MGLDMYLERKIYLGGKWDNDIKVLVFKGNKPLGLDLSNVEYVTESCGYWRKANAIHQWFVTNVQNGEDDCGEYHVSDEKLQALLELCKKVLAYKDKVLEEKDTTALEQVHELLPTQSGFFFGSLDYDEYYFDCVASTISIITEVLKENAENAKSHRSSIYYSSSW